MVGCDAGRIEGVASGAVGDVVAVAGEVGRVAAVACHFVLDDIGCDNPVGIDLHVGDLAVQERRLGGGGTKADAHVQLGVGADGP